MSLALSLGSPIPIPETRSISSPSITLSSAGRLLEKSRFPNPGKTDQATGSAQKKQSSYTRKTQQRAHKRASKDMKLAIRKEKLFGTQNTFSARYSSGSSAAVASSAS